MLRTQRTLRHPLSLLLGHWDSAKLSVLYLSMSSSLLQTAAEPAEWAMCKWASADRGFQFTVVTAFIKVLRQTALHGTATFKRSLKFIRIWTKLCTTNWHVKYINKLIHMSYDQVQEYLAPVHSSEDII